MRRLGLDVRAEGGAGEDEERRRLDGHHGGGAGLVVEQAHLAEEVPGRLEHREDDLPPLLPEEDHLHLPLREHVERVARVVLTDDDGAGRELAQLAEPLEVAAVADRGGLKIETFRISSRMRARPLLRPVRSWFADCMGARSRPVKVGGSSAPHRRRRVVPHEPRPDRRDPGRPGRPDLARARSASIPPSATSGSPGAAASRSAATPTGGPYSRLDGVSKIGEKVAKLAPPAAARSTSAREWHERPMSSPGPSSAPRVGDRDARRRQVDAVRAGGERHVEPVVDEEELPGLVAGAPQRPRQVEERPPAEVLLAEVDRRDAPGEAAQRRRDPPGKVRREPAIGDQVDAGSTPFSPCAPSP